MAVWQGMGVGVETRPGMGDYCSVDVVPRWDGQRPLVVVGGQVSLGVVERLTRTLKRLSEDHTEVLLDLSTVEFLDSAGLRGLIEGRQMFQVVVLLDATNMVRRLLRLTGAESLFAEPE